MVKSVRVILPAVIIAAGGVSVGAVAKPSPKVFAAINSLPDSFFRQSLKTGLMQTLHDNPVRFQFFGDVGPSLGCAEIDRLATDISVRDAAKFRIEYMKAANVILGPGALLSASPRWFANNLRDIFGTRIAKQVDVQSRLLSKGSVEILYQANRWSRDQGYAGRRLGYNKSGKSYWEFNPASTWFVCANPPADRAAVLENWNDR